MWIIETVKWYVVLLFLGMIGFPFCFQFLRSLSGKGYAFSKPIGLLFVSYAFWVTTTFGLTKNNIAGLLSILFLVSLLSLCLWRKNFQEIRFWIKKNIRYIVTCECIFLFGFLLIILLRLGNPDISGTEKPMEMMFINSILQSETFPPHDSWLSGYSISYYYFGYIMTCVLIMISAVPSAVGFNLMLASVFGMAAVGTFAIINDLIEKTQTGKTETVKVNFCSIMAPLMILICGNLEGILEVFHSLHFFWNENGTSSFWEWINLKELTAAPVRVPCVDPTGRSGIWWWRASRVLSDTTVNGNSIEIIDEFPMFSFFLGDLHPHVIGIPFVLLAIAVSMNMFFSEYYSLKKNYFFIEGLVSDKVSIRQTWLFQWVTSLDFWFSVIVLGALIFINTWDFPFYFGIYCIGIMVAFSNRQGWSKRTITRFFEAALPLGCGCILFYTAFLWSFSSQAGGIIPSGVFSTRFIYLFIMFGLFLIPVAWWLIQKICKVDKKTRWTVFKAGLILLLIIYLVEIFVFFSLQSFTVIGSAILAKNPSSGLGSALLQAGSAYAGVQGFENGVDVFGKFIISRLKTFPTTLLLSLFLFFIFGLFKGLVKEKSGEEKLISKTNGICSISDQFVLILIFVGTALLLFPEFFYLRDLFGTRMNTIFKFYYQAWILFGLAAVYILLQINITFSDGKFKVLFHVCTATLILAACVYPFFCVGSRVTQVIQKASNKTLTLDGAAYHSTSRSDDWLGVQWLQTAEIGVVMEKVGASYSDDNIVAVYTGFPAVQGPANHESQWRGGYNEIGSRSDDVKRAFETKSWEIASSIIEKYHIRYIYIGSAERNEYNVQEKKFAEHLSIVFDVDGCKIYQVY